MDPDETESIESFGLTKIKKPSAQHNNNKRELVNTVHHHHLVSARTCAEAAFAFVMDNNSSIEIEYGFYSDRNMYIYHLPPSEILS